MPTKTGERPAFPCLACVREQGRPDNDWYEQLAEIVISGEVNSMEIWSLLRKRQGQYSHNLIHRIVCIADENTGFQVKVGRISEAIREYGVPRMEDEHACGKKKVRAHTD